MSDIVQRLRDIAHGINAASNQAALREAADEIERLTTTLRTANANHERYEREWYLRGDEIERLRAERNELRDLAGSNDCHIAHEAADYIDALLARCEAVEARLAEAHDLLALAAGVALLPSGVPALPLAIRERIAAWLRAQEPPR